MNTSMVCKESSILSVRPSWAVYALLFVVGLSGCGKSGASTGITRRCKVDRALIAEGRACRADDNCPCGSACKLGQCVAECLSDSECSGNEVCDQFGRCRIADGHVVAALTVPPAAATVGFSSSVVHVSKASPSRPFRLVVKKRKAESIRVEAGPGVQIQCEQDGEFKTECKFEGLGSGEDRVLQVRFAETGDAEASGVVRVFAGDKMESLSVTNKPIGEEAPPVSAALKAGVFSGQATLMDVGTITGSEAPSPIMLPRDTRTSLTARLFLSPAGTGTLIITDPLGLLHPSGKLIGRVTATSATAGKLRFPAFRFISGHLTKNEAVEVMVDTLETTYAVGSTGMSFDMPMHLSGMLMGNRVPFIKWQVGLSRNGDLPEGAKVESVPAAAEPTLLVSRGNNPTEWEGAVVAAATPEPTSLYGRNEIEKRALFGTYAGAGAASLEMCNVPASVLDTLASFALGDVWGPRAATGATLRPPTELIQSGLPLVAKLVTPFASQQAASATASLSSSLASPRDLPCAAEFASASLDFAGTCGATATEAITLGTIDLCAKMQQAYGCTPQAATSGELTVKASISYQDATSCTRNVTDAQLVGQVRQICRLPVVPAACGELALCFDPPANPGSSRDTVQSSYLGTAALPISGDLKCASGTRSAAIAADVNAELSTSDPNRLGARDLIAACAADFAVVRSAAPPANPRPFAEGVAAIFNEGRCMDVPRLLYALGLATDADRRRALIADSPVLERASALGQRLVQRWLLQHAFIAREAAQAERMAAVFRTNGQPGAAGVLPPIDEVVRDTLAGLDLLLHPRFATALDRLPDAVLYNPDYRPRSTSTSINGQPYHEQLYALPVTMMETLHALLAALEPRLERAALIRDNAAIALFGNVLRYLVIVRPLAAGLVARAQAYATAKSLPAPAWLVRYESLNQTFSSVLARDLSFAQSILLGNNPLGIADEDLPLYFFGDEEGPNRFSAISDFILGTGPGSFAWGPMLVERATSSQEAARAAYLERLDRNIGVKQSEQELEATLHDIRQTFGEQLAGFCGAPPKLLTADLIEKWRPFNESNCFVRVDSPICEFDMDGYIALMSVEQVSYHMCTVRELRKTMGYMVGFDDEALSVLADRLEECKPEYPIDCADGTKGCLRCKTPRDTLLGRVTPDAFRRLGGLGAVGSRAIEDAQNICLAKFPGVDIRLPSPDDVPNSPTSRAECYSGTLGEAVLALRAAYQDLEIARSELTTLYDSYDIQMQSCLLQQLGAEQVEAAMQVHGETMTSLGAAKLAADVIAHSAEAAKDCSDSLDIVDNSLTGGAKSALVCSFAAVQATGESSADGFEYAMNEAERSHALVVKQLESETANQVCLKNAEMALVGVRSATLRIERAMSDIELTQFQLQDLKVQARAAFDDGNAALAAAKARYVPPLSHDLWLDESIETFLHNMRVARRLVYIAVRAVEYETQQSLALRGTVLAATLPSELQKVIDALWASSATRGVNGKKPTSLKVVLSLRKQLLQLADQTWMKDNEQQLTEAERFQLLLTAKRHAVFDNDGKYLGQRIPFQIAPLGAIQLGDAEGIPVLAGSDCAERLWSVNASVIGDPEKFYQGDAPTFTRIELEKSNTFYSQWCSKEDTPFQVGSVRPSRNLFREPTGADSLNTGLGLKKETELFTKARIEAYFNIDRETFEADDYANGETSELAARGLYGEYALFIPAEMLSRKGSDGLVLNAIDDILLRLDYVSVAR